MTEFDEFYVFLAPKIDQPGNWDVMLKKCSIPALTGPKGSIHPTVTKGELDQLRSQHGWPNLDTLKTIGNNVWQTVMTADLKPAFDACLAFSETNNRGLRLIFAMEGADAQPVETNDIRLQELPIEVLHGDSPGFVAINPKTTISRSLNFEADRDPIETILPLRILVIVATPIDKPTANMTEEKKIIENALTNLTGLGGAVELDFCDPPTKEELGRCLQRKYHIIHFIGHGGFDIVGDDPSPRPFLCLEDPLTRESDALDADSFAPLLQSSTVQLLVMTACSTAEAAPEVEDYHARVFDGMAQRLIAGSSGVNAVVAMQFDLESDAAVIFSREFYTNLLSSGLALDEIVAKCRRTLVLEKEAGHRAWVTPVVYSRSKEGKVFDVLGARHPLDEATEKRRIELEATIETYLKNITDVMAADQTAIDAMQDMLQSWRDKVDLFRQELGALLGETVRLFGGRVRPADTIDCSFTFRLRTPARLENISLNLTYPSDKVSYVGKSSGKDILGITPIVDSSTEGKLAIQINNVSEGVQWAPGEYELAQFTFSVLPDVTEPFIEIKVVEALIEKEDNPAQSFQALDAVLFVI